MFKIVKKYYRSAEDWKPSRVEVIDQTKDEFVAWRMLGYYESQNHDDLVVVDIWSSNEKAVA